MRNQKYKDVIGIINEVIISSGHKCVYHEIGLSDDVCECVGKLNEPVSIDYIVGLADADYKLSLLYVHNPNRAGHSGINCCIYSKPAFGTFVKISAVSDDTNFVHNLRFKIYFTKELYYGSLINELENKLTSGIIIRQVEDKTFLLDFC